MSDDTIVLSYKYRLLPTRRQHRALEQILESQRHLYNAALESRIDCYRKTGKSLSCFSQFKHLTELRADAEYRAIPANVQRATLERLDNAYSGFFRRLKSEGKAGFPRFKGKGWWSSFGFKEFCGIRFDGRRLRFKGLPGRLRVHLHRPFPDSKMLGCTFKRDHKGWSVSFQIAVAKDLLPHTGRTVGIDMGLSSLAVTSTGEHIPNPKVAKKAERELRSRQRAVSRCKRGSKRRAKVRKEVTRLHAKIVNTRQTYLHQVSAKLVRENDIIVIENLNIKGLASGMLAKSVHDASWGKLEEYLTYKAEKAGRQLIKVNPKNTTQDCSGCGALVPKKLSDRWHNCPHCGLSLHRDHNAALVILARSGAKASQREAVACA